MFCKTLFCSIEFYIHDGMKKHVLLIYTEIRGPGSSVGIATIYGLDGPGIESRCGRDFPHLSRPTLGPTQPLITMGTGSLPGVESGRGVTLSPHPLLVPRTKTRVELYL
jgi:hypothetical protein